nr:mucin-12-like [Rattus norvegicus]
MDMESLTFSFDPVEYCFQKAAKDFGHYFYPEDLNGTLTCVNNCTQETKSRLNCNRGYCQLLRAGPQCVCPNTDNHWYWGKTCEFRTSKRLVYGLVGTVLALLLVLVIILAVFFGHSQRAHSVLWFLNKSGSLGLCLPMSLTTPRNAFCSQ